MLEKRQIIRFLAKSYDLSTLSKKMRTISNIKNGEIEYPSLTYLYGFRVVVCTLQTAGCFVRARVEPDYNSSNFSHVFIDEAAFAQESMTLIPIAGISFAIMLSYSFLKLFNTFHYYRLMIGLCTEYGEVKSRIVLAGDPKQLDAVIKSKNATKFGAKTSLMEQLSTMNCYKANKGCYDPRFIVQLIRNYRSHPDILKISNMLFYENMLLAEALTGE